MSAEFSCDYWATAQYAYHYNRSNQFYNESQKVNAAGTGGDYQGQLPYPNSFEQVKEEPAYNTCAYTNINQTYSNLDNSISPPPINHGFTNNLSHFDSCRQAYTSLATSLSTNDSRPSSTFVDEADSPGKVQPTNDSPALRALLTRPEGKKTTYNYSNLHKSAQEANQEQEFDGRTFNEPKSQRFDSEDGEKNTEEEQKKGDEAMASLYNTFYPWMKTSHGNCFIVFSKILTDIVLKKCIHQILNYNHLSS